MDEANLVIVRHGRSEWNNDRRMTGWSDVRLNERGRREARAAAGILRREGYQFDVAFTSWLQRAEETLTILLKELGQADLPVQRSWRLNERHYGVMQGMSREEAKQKFGLEQFKAWQTGYIHRPPEVAESDPRYPGNDTRYAELPPSALPRAESMKDTLERVMPCWEEEIRPALKAGRRVLVVAHKTTVRVLRKQLEGISDADISNVLILTGAPMAYRLDAELNLLWRKSLNPEALVKRLALDAWSLWTERTGGSVKTP
jgi:2,3-bisphosphoglycerate-dependent phosphoglycerate mutase